MTTNLNFEISWKHNNEKAKNYLSNDELRDAVKKIISTNNSRLSTLEAVDKLLASQEEFRRSFSKCFIRDTETNEEYEGIGIVHPNDNFNRKIGMEVSFRDAVSKITKVSTRKKLWVWYLRNYKKDCKVPVINLVPKEDPTLNKYGL